MFNRVARIAAVILLAMSIRVAADDTAASESVLFDRGNAAYDRGDYDEALSAYRELFSRGHYTVETLYNAANATFRSGSPGEAVLLYRRAWYLNPRDPDIKANMTLALQRVGAAEPGNSLVHHAAEELSQREWLTLLKMSYWALLAALAVMMLAAGSRRFLKPVAAVAVIGVAAGLGGWAYWYHWQQSGESVITTQGQTALYEPREKATPFFAAPEGAIVVVEDRFDSWSKVRYGQNSGWVRNSAVERVYPWNGEKID